VVMTASTMSNPTRSAHVSCWTRGARKGPEGVTAGPGGRSEAGSLGSSSSSKRLGAQGQLMDERLKPAILQAATDASVGLEWLGQTSMSRPPCDGP